MQSIQVSANLPNVKWAANLISQTLNKKKNQKKQNLESDKEWLRRMPILFVSLLF